MSSKIHKYEPSLEELYIIKNTVKRDSKKLYVINVQIKRHENE